MATPKTAATLIKTIADETASISKTLQHRIDAAKVLDRGVLEYSDEALSKISIEEASGAYRAITGEGILASGSSATQKAFTDAMDLDTKISRSLYNYTDDVVAQDANRKLIEYQNLSKPQNVIQRQNKGRTRGWNNRRAPSRQYVETQSGAQRNMDPIGSQKRNQQAAEKFNESAEGRTAFADEEEAQAIAEAKEVLGKETGTTATHDSSQVPSTGNKQQIIPENNMATKAGEQTGAVATTGEPLATTAETTKAKIEKQAAEVEAAQKEVTDKTVDATPGTAEEEAKNNPLNFNWGKHATAVMGTVVGGAMLVSALSSNRGQQTNAQLYGQQPLY